MIPESFIEEVLSRTDIVQVIGRYVKLQHKGSNWMACCPFHKEKTPSFAVNPSKQFYKCFGCGEHGTAITFLMKFKGLSFPDAIKELADNLGMEVTEDRQAKVRQAKAKTLTDYLAQAADFYHQALFHDRHAIEYLKGRGITEETVNKFQLGLSPDTWQGLQSIFKAEGYEDPKLEECGLVIAKDAHRYDRFRGRIMYPIRNPRGQVIGFGARTMIAGEEPKYLNSPETPVYHKSQELYGLYEARDAIHKKGRAIVCEGYMDVIQMSQGGFLETVAALGTSITPEHVKKLFQLSDHVYFSFDGDAAGFKAARRAMESTLSIISDTQTAHFVLLPQDEDPDSLIKSQGAEAFEAQLRSAFPLSKFFVMDIVREVTQGRGLRTAEDRAQAIAIAKPLLQRMNAHALRQLLLQEFSSVLRMDPGEVATLCGVALLDIPQTAKPAKQVSAYGRDAKQGERYRRPVRPVTTGPVFTNIKRRLLQCFITHPQWLLKYSDQIEYELLDTVDEWEEAIVRLWHLAQDHSKGENFDPSQLTTGYLLSFLQSDAFYDRLADLASEEEVLQTPAEVAEYEIKCAFLKLEKAQLDAKIAEILTLEEQGENVDSQYLERLFKRRQDIHRSLVDESTQAVDFVLDNRLSG